MKTCAQVEVFGGIGMGAGGFRGPVSGDWPRRADHSVGQASPPAGYDLAKEPLIAGSPGESFLPGGPARGPYGPSIGHMTPLLSPPDGGGFRMHPPARIAG
jgi:hypothetical protein